VEKYYAVIEAGGVMHKTGSLNNVINYTNEYLNDCLAFPNKKKLADVICLPGLGNILAY